MEIKKIKSTSKQLEIEISGENETLLNPITQVLLQQDEVDYASTITKHPAASSRKLYLRLKPGTKSKPETVLKKAIKEVRNQIKTFKKEFEKSGTSTESSENKKSS
jgi:DNA-directed RNA polymerase subunit L